MPMETTMSRLGMRPGMGSVMMRSRWRFNAPAVFDPIRKAEKDALMRAGAIVRSNAKRLTGKQAKVVRDWTVTASHHNVIGRRRTRHFRLEHSSPGEPPRKIGGQLHRLIFFACLHDVD